jgi:hypothetical protein
MALTKTQLRDRVLQELQILAAGQTVSGEDAVLMTSIIDQTFSQYESDIPFLSTSTPDWAAQLITKLIAARASAPFGNAPITKDERDALAEFIFERDRRLKTQRQKSVFF